MGVELVTFCVSSPNSPSAVLGDLTGPQQVELLFRSAIAIDPNTRLTVITDASTDLSAVTSVFSRFEAVIDSSKIMLERCRLQSEFADQHSFERPLVFVDTDILVTGRLEDVFANDFDIGLTWRKADEMPLNGGVIYAGNRKPEVVRQFFRAFFDVYSNKYDGSANWYGDQFAMVNIVDLPFSEIPRTPLVERQGIKIALLPCDVYNYSPSARRPNLLDRNDRALLYHFKGLSRQQMSYFWQFHLSEDRGGAFRVVRALFLSAVLRLQRRWNKRKLKKDARRFNGYEQDQAASVNRAEIAVDLVQLAMNAAASPRYPVADVGCGDRKVLNIFKHRGLDVDYRGFDLAPQSEEVTVFDVNKDTLPDDREIAVVLGVLEYCSNLTYSLELLHSKANYLVVSHAASDFRSLNAAQLRKLNWSTYLSKAEFASHLEKVGFEILEEKITANNRSVVWLCHNTNK